jgi:AmmeMemoRadiSam system protein B
MTAIRPAAVAGMFYPGEAQVLAGDVQSYLSAAASQDTGVPKALIVPHAGYVYSAPIAAAAYACIAAARDTIRRVVLLGPAHRVWLRGLALPSARTFLTPLGSVEIDAAAATAALALPQVVQSEKVHAQEHSIEVQLPFLQSLLADFKLVPFAVGDASAAQVAEVLDLLWGGAETLIVVSSDLSHYHRYAEAQAIDRGTAQDILNFNARIEHEQACGATPINGLLLCARQRGLKAGLLDLRNSADTAGDRSRVVGYGAFAFSEDVSHGGA